MNPMGSSLLLGSSQSVEDGCVDRKWVGSMWPVFYVPRHGVMVKYTGSGT